MFQGFDDCEGAHAQHPETLCLLLLLPAADQLTHSECIPPRGAARLRYDGQSVDKRYFILMI